MKSYINRGKILSVVMGDGSRSTLNTDVHTSFINFYTNLFGTPSVDQYKGLERIQSLVEKKVSLSLNLFQCPSLFLKLKSRRFFGL